MFFTPVSRGVLQRKCACGTHTMGGGQCAECQKTHVSGKPLQTKLAISEPGDAYEQEADRVAEQVMRMSPANMSRSQKNGMTQPLIQRRATGSATGLGEAPPSVHRVLNSPGQPLKPVLQQDLEQRFGYDFSQVRVHSGAAAAQSARDVNASAYTVGHNVVFGAGQFAPETNMGRRLIAHELTHVVQQSSTGDIRMGQNHGTYGLDPGIAPAHNPLLGITSAGRSMVSRATVRTGNVAAEIDYGDLIHIPAADFVTAIQSRYNSYTGHALDPVVVAQITSFTPQQQEWVLFGLDILAENIAQAPGLNRDRAFQRLVDRAPNSTTRGPGTSSFAFEREVLTVSGWLEEAISGRLVVPSASDLSVVDPLLNPPPAPSAPPGGAFDLATFQTELPILTRARLNASSLDPANWPGTRAQPLAQVQVVGDVIQEQARNLFSPFADTARDNRWLAGWQYSANISSVTTDPAGNPAPVSQDERLQLLRNRANGAGWDGSNGPSLFSRTNFDPDRDGTEFEAIITALEADPAVRATLERQFRHTGHLERPALRVAISTEVSSGIPECQTRWTTIRTLCHELMHSLAHPDFVAASTSSPRFPNGVTFNQVLVEGCAEALGVQLFNNLRQRASSNGALRGQLTQGVTGTCTPPSAAATPGYRDAGANAEAIRVQVGDRRFRSAYFHGRVSLIGL